MPPMEVVWDLVISILLPGFVVSFGTGMILLRWKWAGPALVLGIIAANVLSTPLPWFDWDQELGRVCLVLVLSQAIVFLCPDKWWKLSLAVAWVGVLAGVLYYHENIEISHRCAAVAASMVLYGLLTLGEMRISGRTLLALLSAMGLATSLVMLHAHTARLSDVGMMWMASGAGVLLAAFFIKTEIRGVAGPAAVLFPFLLYYGKLSTFSEVPIWSFVLIVAAPLACFLCLLAKNRMRTVMVSAVWLLFLATAVALAMRHETIIAG